MRLDELTQGSTGRVARVTGEPGFRRRLLELGFVPGTPVERTGQAPFGDPLQFRVREVVVGLRRVDAAKVELGAEPAL